MTSAYLGSSRMTSASRRRELAHPPPLISPAIPHARHPSHLSARPHLASYTIVAPGPSPLPPPHARSQGVSTQVGTPPYMSPELVAGHEYGTSSDTWAVGIVLFEMLALCRPYEGANSLMVRAIRPHPPSSAQMRAACARARVVGTAG